MSSSSDLKPNHGILKTRLKVNIGVGQSKTPSALKADAKPVEVMKRLNRSSSSNIISLKKAPMKDSERKKVSFGNNQVRKMSPAKVEDLRNKLDITAKDNKKTVMRKVSVLC